MGLNELTEKEVIDASNKVPNKGRAIIMFLASAVDNRRNCDDLDGALVSNASIYNWDDDVINAIKEAILKENKCSFSRTNAYMMARKL